MRRLKQSEVAAWRARQTIEQNGLCAITGRPLDPSKSAADHDHANGMMRGTLGTWVNAQLGRIENAARRLGGVPPIGVPEFLRRCAEYLDFHAKNPSNVLHHTYKSPEEKAEARKKKAAATRKRKAAE